MKRGLITCNGKTPDATMASALYTDLKRRDINSLFIRPHEGLFGLREWTSEENGHFEVHAASWCCWKLKPQVQYVRLTAETSWVIMIGHDRGPCKHHLARPRLSWVRGTSNTGCMCAGPHR